MNIIETNKNLLMNRDEIILIIENSELTPQKIELIKGLSEHLKKPEGNIIIDKIESNFGKKSFLVKAKIYNSAENAKKYEIVSRKQRRKDKEIQAQKPKTQ